MAEVRRSAEKLKSDHMNMTQMEEDFDSESDIGRTFRDLRQLHKEILEIEKANKKRRISFIVANQFEQAVPEELEDIEETSFENALERSDVDCSRLFTATQINDDLHKINAEIETKEQHVEDMEVGENHHLQKARMVRQIKELTEQVEKINLEKNQLVVTLNSSKLNEKENKKDKLANQRRQKIKELEAQMAQLNK